jgi:hypothetical protein
MWDYLRQRYQPSGDSLYLSMVHQEHALQQGDSSIEEFYTQSSAIWLQLDSLRSAVCGTCPCCRIVRSDLEFQQVYEFMSRLRLEFEQRRAQLIAHGHVPLSVVLSELRAEETHLRGVGLLGVPSVLAARAPTVLAATLGPSRSSAPPHCWLLLLMVWVAVEVAPLMVEVALALLAFSVAIVRSLDTPRLIATRRCWIWAVLLRVGLVLPLRVRPSLRRILRH